MTIPSKFIGQDGTPNVQALAQSLTHLGGNPGQYIGQDGSVNVESMAAAYTALEQEKGSGQPQPDPKPEPKPNALDTAQPDPNQPIDWDSVGREIATTGQVSDANRATLKQRGITDAAIDSYARGIKAEQELAVRSLADSIGGMDEYNRFIKWANTNMTLEQRQALGQAMAGPGGQFALQGAYAQFAQNPDNQEPTEVNTAGGGAGGGSNPQAQPFTSKTERHGAFADPRYGRDPEYTKTVQDRIRATAVAQEQGAQALRDAQL